MKQMNKFLPFFVRRFNSHSVTKFPPISLYIPTGDPLPEEINVIWNFARGSTIDSTEKVKYVIEVIATPKKKETAKEDTDHRIRAGLCAVGTLRFREDEA